jgi:phenylacetate-coenzyme A ligase PaaK-like adenylate-forming protein
MIMDSDGMALKFDRIENYLDLSSEQIIRLQEKKLKEFMRYQLYPFSPFYKKLFDHSKIDPASIKTIKDLEKIPLTTKENIMPTKENPKAFKDFILQPDLKKIKKHWPKSRLIGLKIRDILGADLKQELLEEYYPTFLIATSGTTGNNVPFMYSLRDIKQFSNAYVSIASVIKLDKDYVVLNVFPFAPHLAFVFVNWINVHSTYRIFHSGGGAVTSTAKALDVVNRADVNMLVGIPSYIYHMLTKAQEMDVPLKTIKLVATAGEKLTETTRKRMEEILKERGAKDFHIYDVYGTTEMRDAVAECQPGSKTFHFHPNIHIMEIVDPKTGKQKKPGESGALVVTNIDGRGTVVCRFLIGDIFEGGLQYGKCPHCGSCLPRLVGPIGRIRDYTQCLDLTKVKGTLVNMNAFFDLIPSIEGVEEWQVSIEKKNNDPSQMDVLKINVAPAKGVDKEKLAKTILNKVNDALEIKPFVDTSHDADTLFEEMGGKIKVQRIVDKRQEVCGEAKK